MRKLWLLLILSVSWWGLRPRPVVAAYDPAQGGVFWEPPEEAWLLPNKFGFIPFGYAPAGDLSVTTIAKNMPQGEIRTIDGETTTGVIVNSHNSHLGVSVRIVNPGRYVLNLSLATGGELMRRTVILNVGEQSGVRQLVPLPNRPLMSPLPVLAETTGIQGASFEPLQGTGPEGGANGLGWVLSKPLVFVPPDVLISLGTIVMMPRGYHLTTTVDGQTLPVTLTYGLDPVTAIEGHPLTLDSLYLKPLPDTTLTFTWTYNPDSPQKQTVTSTTPSIPIPETWHADGQLNVMLQYAYNNKTVTLRSNTVAYHYQSQAITTRRTTTVAVSDLLQHDLRVNASLADWHVSQPGDWQLEVAVSPLQTQSGARLAATLRLPDGTQIAAGQSQRVAYTGDQVVPLAQAEWLLQQQPAVVAGQYNGSVRFTAIFGPE